MPKLQATNNMKFLVEENTFWDKSHISVWKMSTDETVSMYVLVLKFYIVSNQDRYVFAVYSSAIVYPF